MVDDTIVYNAQLDAFSLYHLIQESDTKKTTGITPALPALGHALAGSLATATAKAVTYPLDLVITRLQVQRQLRGKGEAASAGKDGDAEYANLVDAAKKIYANERGLKSFYVGVSSEIGKGLADSFLFFLAYTFLRQRELQKAGTRNLPVLKELAVGVVAGAFSKFFTTPIQNVVTRQQTAALISARDPSSSHDDLSFMSVLKRIGEERGMTGYWAGYGASLILTLNPSITFAVDNLLQRFAPRSHKQSPSPFITFLLAASSKAIASTITYPISLAKSRAQAASPGDEETRTSSPAKSSPWDNTDSEYTSDNVASRSDQAGLRARLTADNVRKATLKLLSAQTAIFASLRKIYKEEGVSGLYSGVDGEVVKGFLQHGLTMTVKESAHVGVIQSYYFLLRLMRKYDSELQKAKDAAVVAAEEAKHRTEEAGNAVIEGGKQMLREGQKVVGGEQAMQHAEEVGNAAIKGGKSLLEEGQKAIGGDRVKQGVEVAGIAVIEGGKQALREGRKIIGGD